MRGRRRRWLALSAGCALGGARAQAGYSVAVVPQFPAAELHRDWTPLLERLARDTGLRLHLTLAPSIPRFEAALMAGQPDFCYLNPYHQVMAHRAHGYVPLVRDAQPLAGLLVVRRDDPVRSVRELDGQTVAFPSPNAFGASPRCQVSHIVV